MAKRNGLLSIGTLQRGLVGDYDKANAAKLTERAALFNDTGKLYVTDGAGIPMPVFPSDATGGARVRLVNGQVGGKDKAKAKLKRGRGRGGRVTLWTKD